MYAAAVASSPFLPNSRASDDPGKGEPASRSSTSTIVAARSRRLTVSLTTCLVAVPPGGTIRRGTCSSV